MGASQSHDMAIGLVFFNPANSKRLLMNYLYVWNLMKTQGLPVFTLELVFGDAKPEIRKAFHVRGNSYMFHKERLCRLLEERIPKKFKKIVFLDADVVFDGTKWYEETSKLLETHDVVQPFTRAHWLDLTYTNIELSRETVLHMKGGMWDFKYHPGFAWAFRREWYNEVGFYDWAVTGSGDTLSTAKWLNKAFPEKFKSLPMAMKRSYAAYRKLEPPSITCREGDIFHLYHGSRKKRQYSERHHLLDVNEDIQDMIRLNDDGVYEWKNPKWNAVLYDYFKNREDDDVSGEPLVPAQIQLTS
jgi:hypothetical protein